MRSLFFSFCVLAALGTFGQNKPIIVPAPIVFKSPETGWGLGGFVALILRADSSRQRLRPASFSLSFLWCQFEQRNIQASWQYFGKGNAWFTKGEVIASKNRLLYFGSENQRTHPFRYGSVVLKSSGQFLKSISKNWYCGPRYVFEWFLPDAEKTLYKKIPTLYGASGFKALGVGGGFLHDSRDYVLFPTKGWFAEFHGVVSAGHVDSEARIYSRLVADVVYLKKQHAVIWATNLYASVMTGKIPFDQITTLGSGRRLRGCYDGYYREKQIYLLQEELRFPIYKRVSGVAFASIGACGTKKLIPAWSYGAGLRFCYDKKSKVNLRVDLGFAPSGQKGLYFTVGEAF